MAEPEFSPLWGAVCAPAAALGHRRRLLQHDRVHEFVAHEVTGHVGPAGGPLKRDLVGANEVPEFAAYTTVDADRKIPPGLDIEFSVEMVLGFG